LDTLTKFHGDHRFLLSSGITFNFLLFVEALNNKIRVVQRRVNGLRDEEYLRLKILTCIPEEISFYPLTSTKTLRIFLLRIAAFGKIGKNKKN